MTGRYFRLGADAYQRAGEYIHHYYPAECSGPARADTLTSVERLDVELRRLADAGCTRRAALPLRG